MLGLESMSRSLIVHTTQQHRPLGVEEHVLGDTAEERLAGRCSFATSDGDYVHIVFFGGRQDLLIWITALTFDAHLEVRFLEALCRPADGSDLGDRGPFRVVREHVNDLNVCFGWLEIEAEQRVGLGNGSVFVAVDGE